MYEKKVMPKVLVLLSTYNGEKYLEELLESILSQVEVKVSFLVRDDGSTDNTLNILKEYKKKYSNFKFYADDNIGASQSFFDILSKASMTYDFYAFADQDDVWLPRKLVEAVTHIEVLEKAKKGVLYCGTTTLVDQELNCLLKKMEKRTPSFGNALIENIACGCTMVFNKRLMQFYRKYATPKHAIMHDWWFYLLAAAFGKIVIDEQSYILYRQHENNVLGNALSLKDKIFRRIKNAKKSVRVKFQLIEFCSIYDEISNEQKELINILCNNSFMNKIRLLTNSKIVRQKLNETFLYKIQILLFW